MPIIDSVVDPFRQAFGADHQEGVPVMSPYGAIIDVIDPAYQQALAKQVAVMARMAVSAEGKDTLLLPSAEITAWHEVGHAIMHALTGVPTERVMI